MAGPQAAKGFVRLPAALIIAAGKVNGRVLDFTVP
ncbi:hypothetical protein RD1_1581 [Roseobacter denitrificans OCh 114]|uniref:Uncharacterized protein n=1 Tax=Roseobacter denitrificans (strain ATCC 33942 / OCh 114) TaxID=375451 RepID=Q169Y5_ROSDO|nr:hypothetical protein RD1_1581 [Roseobacter denitrificans OCh 114]